MKRNDFLELKSLDVKALKIKVKDTKKKLADLIMDKNMNKLKDLKSLSKTKKDIAQMATVINQKLTLEKLEKELEAKKETK